MEAKNGKNGKKNFKRFSNSASNSVSAIESDVNIKDVSCTPRRYTVTIDLSKQMSPNKPNPFGKWNKQTELYEVTPIVFVDGNYYMA